jgi:hypothetical protein
MLDWQTIAVALIVAGALFYVARRGLSRLRSFRPGGEGGAPSCATGCGKCGEDAPAPSQPATRVVQISRARTPAGQPD